MLAQQSWSRTRAPRAVRELFKVVQSLGGAKPRRQWQLAAADMLLLRHEHASVVSRVFALSPSPASVSVAMSQLGRVGLAGGRPFTFPQANQNGAAVVLAVDSGGVGVLLASDLEVERDADRGWRAVVDAPGREAGLASLVKVAHHGSVNADADVVWQHLLREKPVGLVTHFHNGSVHLPQAEPLGRIAGRCCALFSTSGPAYNSSALTVEELADSLAAERQPTWLNPGLGHLRARLRPGGCPGSRRTWWRSPA